MNKMALQKALGESYQMQEEMLNLLNECFDEIFKERKLPKYRLGQNIECFDEYGCLQDLSYFKKLLEEIDLKKQ